MIPKNVFALIFIMFFFLSTIYAQEMDCGSTGTTTVSPRSGCDEWGDYSSIDVSKTPIKTIRVTLHIFQKNDGTGNFVPYTSTGAKTSDYWWLKGVIDNASSKMGTLQPMRIPSTSEFLPDSRIRLELMNIYVWPDSSLWAQSNYFIHGNNHYN